MRRIASRPPLLPETQAWLDGKSAEIATSQDPKAAAERHQVEHWRPKSRFWLETLAWANLLWVCGQCNLAKGERFDAACPSLNPVHDDIWQHCYIDEFGQLNPVWNPAVNGPDPRGEATIALLELNREALQTTRHARLKTLRKRARQAVEDLRPGAQDAEEPFCTLLAWL